MSVAEHELVAALRQAGRLLLHRLVKTLMIDLDVKSAREFFRPRLQLFRIRVGRPLYFVEIPVEPRTVQARLIQILGTSNEGSRPSLDCRPQCAEISARLRSKEQQSLLGARWHSDDDSLFANLFRPTVRASEPVIGRRIRGPAKERDDQQIVNR